MKIPQVHKALGITPEQRVKDLESKLKKMEYKEDSIKNQLLIEAYKKEINRLQSKIKP